MSKKILFINQEIAPYVPTSELSHFGTELPKIAQENGYEIRTFMPKWGNINERRGQLHEVIRLSGINISIDDTDHPLVIKVASIPTTRIQVYFIDNEDYFTRKKMDVDDGGIPFSDNGQRAIFFARGVIETAKKLKWNPDIIHCQGWMSSLVPILIRRSYADEPTFSKSKIVTSLFHNEIKDKALSQNFKKSMEYKKIRKTDLKEFKDDFDYAELDKLAITYSDGIIQANSTLNQDILSYANEKGKLILPFREDFDKKEYITFYNNLLEE